MRFHSFPLKIECFKKWLAVMTREQFIPKKHSRIYGDRISSSDYYPSSCMLLKTSIPSGFDFPQHLEMVVTKRRQGKAHILKETVNERPSSSKYSKLPPTKAELKDIQNRRRKSIH